jgi:hypothetical protein
MKKKLVLDRETVATLQSDALDAVAGGCANCNQTTGAIVPRSQLFGGGCASQQISWGGNNNIKLTIGRQ